MHCPNCGKTSTAGETNCANCASPLPLTDPAVPTEVTGSVYAAFWRRAIAVIIDFIIIYVVLILCGLVLIGNRPLQVLVVLTLYFLIVWLYFALFESSTRQATLGKLALGIKVTDSNGARIGFGRATVRAFSRYVSTIPLDLGFLVAAFTARRQSFHDMIAETLVVNQECSESDVTANEPADSGSGAVIVFLVVGIFGLLFVTGILAAIAIPAYQNYTVRAQVTEGLTLAGPYRRAVTKALAQSRPAPDISSTSLGLSLPSSGKYVQSIEVWSGAITITYGNAANATINGKTLTLVPALDADHNVAWICAGAPVPDKFTPVLSNPARFTGVARVYLPSSCHK